MPATPRSTMADNGNAAANNGPRASESRVSFCGSEASLGWEGMFFMENGRLKTTDSLKIKRRQPPPKPPRSAAVKRLSRNGFNRNSNTPRFTNSWTKLHRNMAVYKASTSNGPAYAIGIKDLAIDSDDSAPPDDLWERASRNSTSSQSSSGSVFEDDTPKEKDVIDNDDGPGRFKLQFFHNFQVKHYTDIKRRSKSQGKARPAAQGACVHPTNGSARDASSKKRTYLKPRNEGDKNGAPGAHAANQPTDSTCGGLHADSLNWGESISYKKKKKSLAGVFWKRGTARKQRARALSGSIMSLFNVDPDKRADKEGAASAEQLAPLHLLATTETANFRQSCVVFLEGCMGVGKTSLIRFLNDSLGWDDVITFPEPLDFWTNVYDNIVQTVYKAAGSGNAKASPTLLSCQLKFAAPLTGIINHLNRQKHPADTKSITPMDKWLIFDRHPLSPLVVFPLVLLKRGLLTCQDFISLMSTFKTNPYDVIVLLDLDPEENLHRIKKRGRKFEKGIDAAYLDDLGQAFHLVYNAWKLLQYFTPRDAVKACLGTVPLADVCSDVCKDPDRAANLQKLFNKSIFSAMVKIIGPFKGSATLLQVCLTFAYELQQIQFIVINSSEFKNDILGTWQSIYTQILKNQAIKTAAFEWTSLRRFSQELHHGNQ
ncbi:thymidine kinase [Common bottlenose dolphin gammaherpesvirus 1 strain Sarasota]|uniref:Thymidine kinase n=1 Tax=Common bottlenose dolphin gammaherpesvirus 1 strain Sarasota TaxID=2022783 RepID=A0A1Z1NEF9_9GAMA|nr:thymidine kinase [Common bottlenose dolphin gammaherpesvirus 1 strain Sarasota]ARW78084.1 thymidine kinase [Common bottlenose dolphin gammaherpesvirus 1 strain Sarasota]